MYWNGEPGCTCHYADLRFLLERFAVVAEAFVLVEALRRVLRPRFVAVAAGRRAALFAPFTFFVSSF